MPNISYYNYMYNHKILNNKLNETEIDNCNYCNKDTYPLPNSCLTKKQFIKPTLAVTSLDTNKNVTLDHVKQHLKIVSRKMKSRSSKLNIKMIPNYQKSLAKVKSPMEHKKYKENNRNMLFLQCKH